MKNKKRIYLLVSSMLLIILITVSIPNYAVAAKEITYNVKHLVAKIKKENIYLYYDKKSDDMLKGFYLKSGNKVQYFNWENVNFPSFYPTIKVINKDYIAITCTTAEGSGLNIQELYIINKKTLNKIKITSPIDVVKSNITFDLQAPNISVKIGNKTWSDSYEDIESDNFFENIDYENVIKYDVQNSFFTVTLAVQISPATFIGDIEVSYYFNQKQNTFIPQYINFNFYETSIN